MLEDAVEVSSRAWSGGGPVVDGYVCRWGRLAGCCALVWERLFNVRWRRDIKVGLRALGMRLRADVMKADSRFFFSGCMMEDLPAIHSPNAPWGPDFGGQPRKRSATVASWTNLHPSMNSRKRKPFSSQAVKPTFGLSRDTLTVSKAATSSRS